MCVCVRVIWCRSQRQPNSTCTCCQKTMRTCVGKRAEMAWTARVSVQAAGTQTQAHVVLHILDLNQAEQVGWTSGKPPNIFSRVCGSLREGGVANPRSRRRTLREGGEELAGGFLGHSLREIWMGCLHLCRRARGAGSWTNLNACKSSMEFICRV